MKSRFYWKLFLLGAFFFTLFTGCAKVPPVTSTPEPTSIPTNIPTDIPDPTASPSPQPIEITFEVTFDGNECIGSVPTELPVGDHTFILYDRSDMKAELWLVRLKEGKTYQDLLDMQSAPGEWDPMPRWASHDTRLSITIGSEETDNVRVDTSTWRFYLVGEHILYCYVPSPQMLFYAGPIMVVEAISE